MQGALTTSLATMFKKLSGLDTVAKKSVVFTLPQIDFPRTQHPPWLQNIRNGNPRLQNLRNLDKQLGRKQRSERTAKNSGEVASGSGTATEFAFCTLFTPLQPPHCFQKHNC
jgi:hypothetical protein